MLERLLATPSVAFASPAAFAGGLHRTSESLTRPSNAVLGGYPHYYAQRLSWAAVKGTVLTVAGQVAKCARARLRRTHAA